ncbi:MAG TPA: hypothetical protein VFY11_14440, partial [Nocardioidaceae bacterium]|nr:hypothetical protein [Nocardioidaceae bacterium]
MVRRTSYLWSALACFVSVSVAVPAVATGTAPDSTPDSTSTSTTAPSGEQAGEQAGEPAADPSEEPAGATGPKPDEAGAVEHSSDLTDLAPTEPVLTARV